MALRVLGRQLVAGLVRVDRLVLGGVVLEDAPQRRDEAENRQVDDEDGDADEPFDEHEPAAARDRQQVGEQRRADLEDHHGEADRDEERERKRPASDLGGLRLALLLLGGGVARRDAERAEADRRGSRRARSRRGRSAGAAAGGAPSANRSPCETCAISPSGLRTATAQLRGPRIITPSRTAWPPMACDMSA